MQWFKKWTGGLLMLAMLVAAMPSISSASGHVHHEKKIVQSGDDHSTAGSSHDCPHAKPEPKPCCEKPNKQSCCADGACKCLGNTCHNASLKLIGSDGILLTAAIGGRTEFHYTDSALPSAFTERLKRPPRA